VVNCIVHCDCQGSTGTCNKTRRCSLLHQKPLFDDDDDDDDDDDSWKSGTLLADQLTSSDDCPAEHPFLRLTRGLKRNELIVSPRCIPHRGTEKSRQRTSYDARASICTDQRDDGRHVSSHLTVMYRCIMLPHAGAGPPRSRLRCVSIRAINQHRGIDDDNDDDDAVVRNETSDD